MVAEMAARRGVTRILPGALVVLTLWGQALADDAGASRLLQEAVGQFANGAISEAAGTLHAALGQTRTASLKAAIYLQLALVHVAVQHTGEAKEAFGRALLHDPNLTLDTHRHRLDFVALFRQVRTQVVGEVRLSTKVVDGEVWIDGKPLCRRLPCQRSLVARRTQLELRDSNGFVLAGRSVVVRAGQLTLLELSPIRRVRHPRDTGLSRPPKQDSTSPRLRRRLWTWVAIGGAVAAGVTAVGLGLSASTDYDEACGLLSGSAPCEQRTQLTDTATADRYRALSDAIDRKALAANVMWGVAGGLAVTAAALFWLEPRWGKQDIAARTSLLAIAPGWLCFRLRY